MNTNTGKLPAIIHQRWAAACAEPSIPQWRSLAVWVENFADTCAEHPETRGMVAELRELADEAWRNMVALQPEREAT